MKNGKICTEKSILKSHQRLNSFHINLTTSFENFVCKYFSTNCHWATSSVIPTGPRTLVKCLCQWSEHFYWNQHRDFYIILMVAYTSIFLLSSYLCANILYLSVLAFRLVGLNFFFFTLLVKLKRLETAVLSDIIDQVSL